MYPSLALLFCCGFILWLFRQDFRWRKIGSWALLVPGIWFAIQGSRQVSYWFADSGGGAEGHPINTLTYGLLIASAVVVLFSRRISWGSVVGNNKSLFLIYAFFALGAFLSESPLLSLKRLFKDFGCVLMALVFLTQTDPASAIRTVFVRLSYLIFPLSVVFIKYFPEIGRGASRAGDSIFTGVTTQKNELGEIVFALSLFILWDLFEIRKREGIPGKKIQVLIRLGLLLIAIWLLNTCASKTSMLCLGLGSVALLGTPRLMRKSYGKTLLSTCLIAGVLMVALDKSIGLSAKVAVALGKDPSLTGRTAIWQLVREQGTDPFIGEGYYLFWDSPKGKAVQDNFIPVTTAHNGYLEMYMDGGTVVIVLLGLFLVCSGKRVLDRLSEESPLGAIGLAIFITALVFNLSESSFLRLTPLWGCLLVVVIRIPRQGSEVPWTTSQGRISGSDKWADQAV